MLATHHHTLGRSDGLYQGNPAKTDSAEYRNQGQTALPRQGLTAWPGGAVVRRCRGERISRGPLQYRVLRALRRAGIDVIAELMEVPNAGSVLGKMVRPGCRFAC
jgi:hypothetical protein